LIDFVIFDQEDFMAFIADPSLKVLKDQLLAHNDLLGCILVSIRA
jgi:hypothetical protein